MDDAINDQQSDTTDAEFDNWLREANDGICDSLEDVVDTEMDLLRLKQNVAKKAVAVAHASGSDGADRAIRQVFEDDPQASPGLEGRVRRAAPGPGPRAPGYRRKTRCPAHPDHLMQKLEMVVRIVTAVVAVLSMGAAVFAAPPTLVAAVSMVVFSAVLLWRSRTWQALRQRFGNDLRRTCTTVKTNAVEVPAGSIWRLAAETPAKRGSFLHVLLRGNFWRAAARRIQSGVVEQPDNDATRSVWLGSMKVVGQPAIFFSNVCHVTKTGEPDQDDPTVELDLGDEADDDRQQPPIYSSSGGVAVRSSSRGKRLAGSRMRRARQRPPNTSGGRITRKEKE